jgi:hypothetical protein
VGEGTSSGWEVAVGRLADALSDQSWKPDERELRRQEVRTSRISLGLNALTTVATAIAAVAAAMAAYYAGSAVNVARTAIDRQTLESRFSDAVQAVGSDQAAGRVAGFIMLRRNVEQRLNQAEEAADPADSVTFYNTALDVIENYLKTAPAPSGGSVSTSVPTPAGPVPSPAPAVGGPPIVPATGAPAPAPSARPAVPQDRIYAAGQLKALLAEADRDLVRRYSTGPPKVYVDLSNAELFGVSWPDIDFSWLSGKYLAQIDLRGANLTSSKWGNAGLAGSLLQCANLHRASLNDEQNERMPPQLAKHANLVGANLRGANLSGADLRNADLSGADVTGAHIDGARLDGAILTGVAWEQAIGRDVSGRVTTSQPSGPPYDKDGCLQAMLAAPAPPR